jgi:hypothetical protein
MNRHQLLFAQLLVGGNLVFSHVIADPSDEEIRNAEALRPLLNSQRIERIFGSYEIDVVKNGPELRVSDLHSIDNGEATTRTLALVTYDEQIDQELTDEHRMIVRGSSIGEVFLDFAWVVEKENRYFGEIEASQEYAATYKRMGDIDPTNLTVHIYELFVRKGDLRLHYADIAEVHHPDYFDLQDLREIYAEIFDENREADEKIEQTLDLLKEEMKTI